MKLEGKCVQSTILILKQNKLKKQNFIFKNQTLYCRGRLAWSMAADRSADAQTG